MLYIKNLRKMISSELEKWYNHRLSLSNEFPKATAQQSLAFCPAAGSILATGSDFCLGSQT